MPYGRLPALVLLLGALMGQWVAAVHAAEHVAPEVQEVVCVYCAAQPVPGPTPSHGILALEAAATVPLREAVRARQTHAGAPASIRGPPVLSA